MIPGLNHNIRYREKVFHVQTEDSGFGRCQLTTHIFYEGSVVGHERSPYAPGILELKEDVERANSVRKQMQEQHRRLLKQLVSGERDEALVKLGLIEAPPPPPVEVASEPGRLRRMGSVPPRQALEERAEAEGLTPESLAPTLRPSLVPAPPAEAFAPIPPPASTTPSARVPSTPPPLPRSRVSSAPPPPLPLGPPPPANTSPASRIPSTPPVSLDLPRAPSVPPPLPGATTTPSTRVREATTAPVLRSQAPPPDVRVPSGPPTMPRVPAIEPSTPPLSTRGLVDDAPTERPKSKRPMTRPQTRVPATQSRPEQPGFGKTMPEQAVLPPELRQGPSASRIPSGPPAGQWEQRPNIAGIPQPRGRTEAFHSANTLVEGGRKSQEPKIVRGNPVASEDDTQLDMPAIPRPPQPASPFNSNDIERPSLIADLGDAEMVERATRLADSQDLQSTRRAPPPPSLRGRSGPSAPPPQAFAPIEDPAIDDALMDLAPVDDTLLDLLGPSANPGAPPLPQYPSLSAPPLAGAAWLEAESEMQEGRRTSSPPRSMNQARPAIPRQVTPPPTPKPRSVSGVEAPPPPLMRGPPSRSRMPSQRPGVDSYASTNPERQSGIGPAAEWKSNSSPSDPPRENYPRTASAIRRVDERSLDDIIIGYLSSKPKKEGQ
ncbi:MAG: hypothetical protein U1E65_31985 [Myxococcota bacterium]